MSVSLFFIKSTLEVIFSGSPRPFDEISEDRRTHTLTLEHLVPKSLSNMALLKYYGCLLFFKCLQMYPAKAPFQVLKQSQRHCLFSHSCTDRKTVELLIYSPHLVPTVKDAPLLIVVVYIGRGLPVSLPTLILPSLFCAVKKW